MISISLTKIRSCVRQKIGWGVGIAALFLNNLTLDLMHDMVKIMTIKTTPAESVLTGRPRPIIMSAWLKP